MRKTPGRPSESHDSSEKTRSQLLICLASGLGITMVSLMVHLSMSKPLRQLQFEPFKRTSPSEPQNLPQQQESTRDQVVEVVNILQDMEFTPEQVRRLRQFQQLGESFEGHHSFELGNGLTVLYGAEVQGGIGLRVHNPDQSRLMLSYHEQENRLFGVLSRSNTEDKQMQFMIIMFPEMSAETYLQHLESWRQRIPLVNSDTDSRSDVPEKSHPETR